MAVYRFVGACLAATAPGANAQELEFIAADSRDLSHRSPTTTTPAPTLHRRALNDVTLARMCNEGRQCGPRMQFTVAEENANEWSFWTDSDGFMHDSYQEPMCDTRPCFVFTFAQTGTWAKDAPIVDLTLQKVAFRTIDGQSTSYTDISAWEQKYGTARPLEITMGLEADDTGSFTKVFAADMLFNTGVKQGRWVTVFSDGLVASMSSDDRGSEAGSTETATASGEEPTAQNAFEALLQRFRDRIGGVRGSSGDSGRGRGRWRASDSSSSSSSSSTTSSSSSSSSTSSDSSENVDICVDDQCTATRDKAGPLGSLRTMLNSLLDVVSALTSK